MNFALLVPNLQDVYHVQRTLFLPAAIVPQVATAVKPSIPRLLLWLRGH